MYLYDGMTNERLAHVAVLYCIDGTADRALARNPQLCFSRGWSPSKVARVARQDFRTVTAIANELIRRAALGEQS